MDTIGKKTDPPNEPDEQDLIDRDLASPQFVSYSAVNQARNLRDVVKTLPELREMLPKAELALNLLIELDNAIDYHAG
ncbi:MAG: hypothetical protein BWY85_02301 [Firmicutes bacterium ADurb.Bin506]|nr:MAG: hypothetical protein BWY85_02301 [Firmicutes bacterium ADurb.Bin506]